MGENTGLTTVVSRRSGTPCMGDSPDGRIMYDWRWQHTYQNGIVMVYTWLVVMLPSHVSGRSVFWHWPILLTYLS